MGSYKLALELVANLCSFAHHLFQFHIFQAKPKSNSNSNNSKPAASAPQSSSSSAPPSNPSSSPIKTTRPGIGFFFQPLGKHLSIHVPSRNDLIMSMAKGERLHNFGTRVTFSSSTSSNTSTFSRIARCPAFGSDLGSDLGFSTSRKHAKKIVSTTTRIAKGQHRVVKRTAYLHRDGRKEVLVEEKILDPSAGGKLEDDGWVVRKRSITSGHPHIPVSQAPQATRNQRAVTPPPPLMTPKSSAADTTPGVQAKAEGDGNSSTLHPSMSSLEENSENTNKRPWFFNLCDRVIRPCLAPCASEFVPVKVL